MRTYPTITICVWRTFLYFSLRVQITAVYLCFIQTRIDHTFSPEQIFMQRERDLSKLICFIGET